MDSTETDDILELGSKTWSRLTETASKAGYRRGIEQKLQEEMQANCDKGYQNGFKVAFTAAFYKGLVAFKLKDVEHPKEIVEILEKLNKGSCNICKLDDFDETNDEYSEDIIAKLNESTSKNLGILHSYFKPLLEDRGIDMSSLNLE